MQYIFEDGPDVLTVEAFWKLTGPDAQARLRSATRMLCRPARGLGDEKKVHGEVRTLSKEGTARSHCVRPREV